MLMRSWPAKVGRYLSASKLSLACMTLQQHRSNKARFLVHIERITLVLTVVITRIAQTRHFIVLFSIHDPKAVGESTSKARLA